jgi:hypothetical protein
VGFWKNKMMEQEDDYNWARGFLCDVGVLEECEAHGDVYNGSVEVVEAYKAMNTAVTSGKLKLKEGQTRRDLTNLLKAVYDDNSNASDCPSCEHAMSKD